MLTSPASVQISISCLVERPPIISDPVDNFCPPALFVDSACQVPTVCELDHLTLSGLIVVSLTPVHPNAIT